VPYADIRYLPVSLYKIKAARDVLRTQGKKRIQQHEIFQAIEAQRKVIDEARSKTREVRRAHARRPGAGSVIQSPSMPPAGEVNYNIEPITYPVEILTDTP
jgi:putative transposase